MRRARQHRPQHLSLNKKRRISGSLSPEDEATSMKVAVTVLVACVATLLALGMVMLYSCSLAQEGARYVVMQFVWGGVGIVFCGVMACMDFRTLKRFAWPLFAISLLLLGLVLLPPIADEINGARRWI